MVPVAPLVTGVTFFYIPHVLYFYGKTFKFQNSLLTSFLIIFLSSKIATSIDTCSFLIITDYDVQFTVKDGSVDLHLLIP